MLRSFWPRRALQQIALGVGLIVALQLPTATPAAAQLTPALAYSSYLGGAGDDGAKAVAVDSQGNMYVAGTTYSDPFPGAAGERRDTNAFVVKLDPSGTQVIYSTLVGGSDDEEGLALAVDSQGNAWITGYTQSADLPLKRALYSTYQGDNDTFVTKLDASGELLLQTYLGEVGSDQANGIALDGLGNAYVAGATAWDFGPAVMVKKINAEGSAQVYQAFFGMAARGFAKGSSANSIAVDTQGNAYVVGTTNTGAFDTEGFQKQCVGFDNPIDDCPSDDGFVVVLNAAGNALIGGTLLGGMASDVATSVALDSERNVYVAGTTFSSDFPTKNGWQTQKQGADNVADGFLVKLAPLGTALSYGTFYGGEGYDEVHGVAVDTAGRAFLTGLTSSDDLAVPGAFQSSIEGLCLVGSTERRCYDAFVAGFDTAGALSWASYAGGTDDDQANGVAIGANGALHVAGRAASFSMPTTAGSFQPKKAGDDDAFLMRISTTALPTPGQQRVYVPLVGR
ncbi:MAG TPA: SBBP repeat-containing protein [Roseiflexaceae bacterium]|nr:SBBP repeat-containing protein [Roseiflexaceae bacterium]